MGMRKACLPEDLPPLASVIRIGRGRDQDRPSSVEREAMSTLDGAGGALFATPAGRLAAGRGSESKMVRSVPLGSVTRLGEAAPGNTIWPVSWKTSPSAERARQMAFSAESRFSRDVGATAGPEADGGLSA